MKRTAAAITAAILTLSACICMEASDFRFRGYTGGMMLHTGYIRSSVFSLCGPDGQHAADIGIEGGAIGIGGQVKLAFGTERDMLRIGSEGHSTTVSYSPSPSYARAGWGGLILDYIRRTKGKVHPFAGVTIGGGGVKNHLVTEGNTSDLTAETLSMMHRYAFMTAVPFIGMEISLTEKLSLMFKADYMFNISGKQPDFPGGVRLYIGIMFNRLQQD